jgi:hypothetical protein
MMAPLNLASRPVRNERLPALLFAAATLALLLVTCQHAVVASRLLPRRSVALRDEVAALKKESEQIDTEASNLRRVSVTAAQKTEWALLKGLIDRRTFEWSRLFALLEQILPKGVRVISVSPMMKEGGYSLEMIVRVQNANVGFEFGKLLEARPEFADVLPKNFDQAPGGEVEILLAMRYLVQEPDTPVQAGPAPAGATPAAGSASSVPSENGTRLAQAGGAQ